MHCIAKYYGYWVKTLAPKRYPKKETCSSADRKATTPWELTAAFGQLHLRTAVFFSLRARGENPWTQMFWWEIHGAFNIFNGNEWGVNQDLKSGFTGVQESTIGILIHLPFGDQTWHAWQAGKFLH